MSGRQTRSNGQASASSGKKSMKDAPVSASSVGPAEGPQKTFGKRKNKAPPSQTVKIGGIQVTAAQLEKLAKQLQAEQERSQQNEEIKAANRSLLAKDNATADDNNSKQEDDDELTIHRPAKKARPSASAPPTDDLNLSDGEKELAGQLSSLEGLITAPQQTIPRTEKDSDDEDVQVGNLGDKEDDDEIMFIDDNRDWDISSPGAFNDNGLIIRNNPKSTTSRCYTSSSSSRTSSSGGTPTPQVHRRSSKVTEAYFDVKTQLPLALAAKAHIRYCSVYVDPFSTQGGVARMELTWKYIQELVKTEKDPNLIFALSIFAADPNLKRDLITFTHYARTGLMGDIIKAARERVPGFYKLSISQGNDASARETVRNNVEWLLHDSHFLFGEVSLTGTERTYNQALPFGCELLVDIVQHKWFPAGARAKADVKTTKRALEEKTLPLTMIFLVASAIDTALREWLPGVKPVNGKIPFSDDNAPTSYYTIEELWKTVADNAPAWSKFWPRKLFKLAVGHVGTRPTSNTVSSAAFSTIDHSALEKLAEEEL